MSCFQLRVSSLVTLLQNKGVFTPAGGVVAGGPRKPDGQARRAKSAATHAAPASPSRSHGPT